MNKKNNFAFTLVEIMVVIVLIMIFFLWIQTLNFWQKSDEQKAEIFANKIISLIETKRNEVLTWRWKIDNNNFKRVKNIEIEYKATNNNLIIKEDWEEKTPLNFSVKEEINKVSCVGYNNSTNMDNFSINFNWDNIETSISENKTSQPILSYTCQTILSFEAWVNWKKFKIIFDPVSWLIKKEKIL